MVLKHCRAGVSDGNGAGHSTKFLESKHRETTSGIPGVTKSSMSIEERVQTFLQAVRDHQAFEVESKKHRCIAFKSIF